MTTTTHILLTIHHRENALQPLAEHAAMRAYSMKGVVDCNGTLIGPALVEVMDERVRQVAKGYNAAHDDQHDQLELADVVGRLVPGKAGKGVVTRQNCIKAMAVLLAMTEKFDRETAAVAEAVAPVNA